MKDEIAKGDIHLSQSGGRCASISVDKILFDSGEAVISKRGEGRARARGRGAGDDGRQADPGVGTHRQQPDLDKLATQFPTNWELSVARAVNVVRFLKRRRTSRQEPDRRRATASTTRSPATRARPGARATAASRSC
jgi:chemotaxis protein MotB